MFLRSTRSLLVHCPQGEGLEATSTQFPEKDSVGVVSSQHPGSQRDGCLGPDEPSRLGTTAQPLEAIADHLRMQGPGDVSQRTQGAGQQISLKNNYCFIRNTEDTQCISVQRLDERKNRKMKLYMEIQYVERIEWLLGRYLTFLCFRFLIHKVEIVMAPSSSEFL